MKKTLSFWSFVYGVLRWVGRGFRASWRSGKIDFIPTEKNLLTSFWYRRDFYRRNRAEDTVYDFLDDQVRILGKYIVDPERKQRARELYGYLLKGLERERIREIVVEFLKSPLPEENYLPVLKAIRGAWRMEEREKLGEAIIPDVGQQRITKVTESENGQGIKESELTVGSGGRPLNARTYVIAVQLYFELEGKDTEFEALSRSLPALTNFIRERFGVEELPGRLDDFKAYSYKEGLKERSSSKRGQLRTPFKQIVQHPEIFGKAIAERAREILERHFH